MIIEQFRVEPGKQTRLIEATGSHGIDIPVKIRSIRGGFEIEIGNDPNRITVSNGKSVDVLYNGHGSITAISAETYTATGMFEVQSPARP